MTRPSRSVPLMIVGLLLAVAPPARATHPGACEGSWSGPKVCEFGFYGLPLRISGTAVNPGKTAKVHVWVTISTLAGQVTLGEYRCEAKDVADEHDCAYTEVGSSLVPVGGYTEATRVACRAEGSGTGSFACSTPYVVG